METQSIIAFYKNFRGARFRAADGCWVGVKCEVTSMSQGGDKWPRTGTVYLSREFEAVNDPPGLEMFRVSLLRSTGPTAFHSITVLFTPSEAENNK